MTVVYDVFEVIEELENWKGSGIIERVIRKN